MEQIGVRVDSSVGLFSSSASSDVTFSAYSDLESRVFNHVYEIVFIRERIHRVQYTAICVQIAQNPTPNRHNFVDHYLR